MYKTLPTQFKGKIWIFIVQALVTGGLACFGLVCGPLFWIGIMQSADRRPATDAGIFLTVVSVPFLLMLARAIYNIVARGKPILRICREGVEVTIIGSTSLDDLPFIPGPIRVAWAILSTQGFRKRIFRVPWSEFRHVEVSGLPMARCLTITTSAAHSNTVSFREHELESSLITVAAAISSYAEDAEARRNLVGEDGTEW